MRQVLCRYLSPSICITVSEVIKISTTDEMLICGVFHSKKIFSLRRTVETASRCLFSFYKRKEKKEGSLYS